MRGPSKFASEAALCDAFMAWARRGGGGREPWTVYPETGGFDLLLVDPHGRQLGIEAKLTMNPKVCVQALPSQWRSDHGPDWRGVLVPKINPDLVELMRLYGVVVFVPCARFSEGRPDFTPALYEADGKWQNWFDWNPAKRCELPPMVPDVPAGVPSPIKLTMWKVGALKVLAHLELYGTVTARQVREYGVDPRRFCAADGWLRAEGNGNWSRGSVPAFDQQHPAEYAATLAQLRERLIA